MLKFDTLGTPDDPGQNIIGFTWQTPKAATVFVLVNYSARSTSAQINLNGYDLDDERVRFVDRLNSSGVGIGALKPNQQNHTLELPPWSAHVFEVEVV